MTRALLANTCEVRTGSCLLYTSSLNKDPVPFDQGDFYWMWYSRGRGVYSASGTDATNIENGTFRTAWQKDNAYQTPTYTGGFVGAYNNASHQLTLSRCV